MNENDVLYTGPVISQAPPKWLQDQYKREAEAQQYAEQERYNRAVAAQFLQMLFPIKNPLLFTANTLETMGGVIGLAQAHANKHNWSTSQNNTKAKAGKILGSRKTSIAGNAMGVIADGIQGVQSNFQDNWNNAELGADVVKAAGDANILKKVPRIGNALDAAADNVGTITNWSDGVVKPAGRLFWELLPQKYKDFIEFQKYVGDVEKYNQQSQQQFDYNNLR